MRRISTMFSGAVSLSALLIAAPAVAGVPAAASADTPPHVVSAVLSSSPASGMEHPVAVVLADDHGDNDGHVEGGHGDFGRGGFGWGFGWGLGNPYWGSPWGPAWGWGYGPAYGHGYYHTGGIRIEVKGVNPKVAGVYVNGGYVGVLDDFNSWWQSLDLNPGTYRIKVEAKGYQPLKFSVAIQPGRTITYRGDLLPVR